MKKLIIIFISFLFLFQTVPKTFAVYNPQNTQNNKFGVHILFPEEIDQAAKLVNSAGGDWGYVTIPIQSGDKDLVKWQKFMDDAAKLHIIPIIRISTEDDYFNHVVWRKPTFLDIEDFANFLNSLSWPTKNRYIIIFNEPNRSDEWGGSVDPKDYAQILSYAVSVFKSKSPDFFILSAGLDNAAITNGTSSMDEFEFMQAMNNYVPGIFNQIDGLASHSYPNPAFSSPPSKQDGESIASYKFEQQIVYNLTGKNLPMFITETGWSDTNITDSQIANYFSTAYSSVWTDPSLMAVTPFILQGSNSPFSDLSLLTSSNTPKPQYATIESLKKTKGEPNLNTEAVLSASTHKQLLPVKAFPTSISQRQLIIKIPTQIKSLAKWILNLNK